MLGLIWVQTVCKSYQQTTLAGKQLDPCAGRQADLYAFVVSTYVETEKIVHFYGVAIHVMI